MQASDLDKRKLLSAVSHGSIFISALVASIGIPIAILFVSEDSVVKENAIIAALSFLTLGLLGFILGPIWFLYHWGLSLWGVIHCLNNPDRAFRYPFIFRLV
jgi:uncharacterized protein